jgi:hypothetical protein
MIEDVYIIRSSENMNKFFKLDPDTGNWEWTPNLEEASIYKTPDKAEQIKTAKITVEQAYIYQIPYFIAQPQQRHKNNKKSITKRVVGKKSKDKKYPKRK